MFARNAPSVNEALQGSRVAICGLGGLGSNVAILLARAGVGELFLIDFDVVEPTNLNRQQYEIGDLYKPKTDALREKIARINPFVRVQTLNERLTAQNVAEILKNERIICECFDDVAAKAMIFDALGGTDRFLICASGMAGGGDANEIRTARLRKNRLCSRLPNAVIVPPSPVAPISGSVAARTSPVFGSVCVTRHHLLCLLGRGRPGQLERLDPVVAADEARSSRRLRNGLLPPEQRPLVGTSGQHDAECRQVVQRLGDRFEHGATGASDRSWHAQDDEVRVVAHVEAHGLQARLVDPDDRGAARRHLLLKRRQVDARGQQTQLGPLRTGPRLRDRTTGVVGAVGQGARRDRPAAPTPRP